MPIEEPTANAPVHAQSGPLQPAIVSSIAPATQGPLMPRALRSLPMQQPRSPSPPQGAGVHTPADAAPAEQRQLLSPSRLEQPAMPDPKRLVRPASVRTRPGGPAAPPTREDARPP